MRARWIIAGALAAVVLLPLVFVAGIYATHPRDESAFVGTLHNASFPDVWTTFVDAHDDKFLITEGDRACEWLKAQPMALTRTSPRFEMANVLDRYLTETQENRDWIVGEGFAARRLVAVAAWNNLCEATLLMHRPYRPFG
jgi:hypothetical protein